MTLAGYRPGGVHPQSSGLRNILRYYGTRAPHTGEPYTEAMVFGVAGGIGVSYWTWEFEGRPPLATIFFRNLLERDEGFFRRACARLNTPVEVFETTSRAKAARAVQEMLAAGQAGLAWLDLASLPHQMQPPELVKWFGYECVVCGYDEAADGYELDDRSPVAWRIAAEALADARAAIASNKHRVAVVSTPEAYPDLGAAIAAGVRDCVEAMARPPIKNLGLPALEKWAGLVANSRNKKGWPTVFPPGAPLFEALTATYSSIVCMGTGGDALRTLYAEFLEESADVVARPAYREAAGMFRLSGKLWSGLAESLLPSSVGPLRRTRSLLNTNRRLFEEQGGAVMPGMEANNAQIAALRAEAAEAFPMSAAAIGELLGDVREQLLAIHELESGAVRLLDDASA